MTQEKILRINFLAKKGKSEELSAQEKEEQLLLRNEYRAEKRAEFEKQLGVSETSEASENSEASGNIDV